MKFKTKKIDNGKIIAIFEDAQDIEINIDALLREKEQLEQRLDFINKILKEIPKNA